MTDKEKVLKVWPGAMPYKGFNFHTWVIMSLGYCKGDSLGVGSTEEAAWQNAAESLPAQAERCKASHCFVDQTAHCDLEKGHKGDHKEDAMLVSWPNRELLPPESINSPAIPAKEEYPGVAARFKEEFGVDHPRQMRKSELKERVQRQEKIGKWCIDAFGSEEALSLPQRGVRLFEEAGEAAQTTGVTSDMAHAMVDYVWNRPVGELYQELGGVGVTTLALAQAAGLDADNCEVLEVQRVLSKPLEYFAQRNKTKNDAGFLASQPSDQPTQKEAQPDSSSISTQQNRDEFLNFIRGLDLYDAMGRNESGATLQAALQIAFAAWNAALSHKKDHSVTEGGGAGVHEYHTSVIDLIDRTLSCTSGLSFGECLEEIKRRLAAANKGEGGVE